MYAKLKWGLSFSLVLNVVFLIVLLLMVHRLGGLAYLKYRLNANTISAMYDHKKSLYEKLDRPKGGIVFLGDSITEAGEWNELLGRSDVRNRGIPGDGTEGVLNRLEAVIALQPQRLFLMIGINDLLFVRPEEVIENYRRIVRKLTKALPQAQIVLQSVLPVNTTVRRIPIDNRSVDMLNQGIQELAEEFGLPFLDIRPVLTDETNRLAAQYTSDGIHLNGVAYLNWAKVIGAYLGADHPEK